MSAPASLPRFLSCADCALTVEFGNAIDPALHARVQALDAAVTAARANGQLPGVIEAVPSFRSLTLLYDPLLTDQAQLRNRIVRMLDTPQDVCDGMVRHWLLPVCYETPEASDLDELSVSTGLSHDEIIACHAAREYVVYMLGFLPGFPFMGDVAPALQLPRRPEPRVRVPAGSVAIATGLTAIYPWESPGGWHLLGRCPVPLFDVRKAAPALLQAGDRVRFQAVSLEAYRCQERAYAEGRANPADLRIQTTKATA